MKIAVPSEDARGMDAMVFAHFGRCQYYTLVDTTTKDVEILKNESTHFGGGKLPPELLAVRRVEVLLCFDIGPRALALFNKLGIAVYAGAQGTVREVIKTWEEGLLKRADEGDACNEHKD